MQMVVLQASENSEKFAAKETIPKVSEHLGVCWGTLAKISGYLEWVYMGAA